MTPRRRYSKVVEADAEWLLVRGIRRLGGRCFKLKFVGIDGAPDRLVIMPSGRMWFVELKQATGRLEPSQEVLFPQLAALKAPVSVLYGIDDVHQFLSAINPERIL